MLVVEIVTPFRARAARWFEKQHRAVVVRAMGRCLQYPATLVVRISRAGR